MKRIGLLLGAAAFLAAVFVVGAPPIVSAQTQKATLYEVTEAMQLTPYGTFANRSATAALMGQIASGNSLCPAYLLGPTTTGGASTCGITAIASDKVNLATGKGPVSGTFSILIQGDNSVDGEELVVATGAFTGYVDLSPVVLGPDGVMGNGDELPLGSMTAKWTAVGTKGGPLAGMRDAGTLTGTFRLPFTVAALGTTPLYLLNPSAGMGGIQPVQADETSLGVPTVRLEIDFVSGGGPEYHR